MHLMQTQLTTYFSIVGTSLQHSLTVSTANSQFMLLCNESYYYYKLLALQVVGLCHIVQHLSLNNYVIYCYVMKYDSNYHRHYAWQVNTCVDVSLQCSESFHKSILECQPGRKQSKAVITKRILFIKQSVWKNIKPLVRFQILYKYIQVYSRKCRTTVAFVLAVGQVSTLSPVVHRKAASTSGYFIQHQVTCFI